MLIHLVRQALTWALSRLNEREQSTALVPVAAPTGAWLQVVDAGSSRRRGFLYRCLCSQNYEYGDSEAHVSKVHTCECCRREFSLVRAVDALTVDGAFKADLENRLSCLPIHALALRSTAASPHTLVGDWSTSDSGQWDGRSPLGSDGSWI